MKRLTSALLEELRASGFGASLQLQRGDKLFNQREEADWVFVVQEGLVKLTRFSDGSGSVILSIAGPGHLIGDDALSEDSSRYFSEAELLTSGEILRIARKELFQVLSNNDKIRHELLHSLVAKEHDMAQKIELLCLQDVEHRILYYLAQLSSLLPRSMESGSFHIPLTQLELADLIGATRETTSTTLNLLEKRGLVKLSRRMMTIASPETLSELATKPPDMARRASNRV